MKPPAKTDNECVDLIRAIMASQPTITRKALYAKASVSQLRCQQLASLGLITLPRPIKASESGRRGRKAAGQACEMKVKHYAKPSPFQRSSV